jgi:hypothetical protein
MVGVVLAGVTAGAVGRAGAIAVDRARADLVAESVVASVAADRVRGLDAAAALARGRVLARAADTTVVRLVEHGDRVEAVVSRHGERGHAVAELEW